VPNDSHVAAAAAHECRPKHHDIGTIPQTQHIARTHTQHAQVQREHAPTHTNNLHDFGSMNIGTTHAYLDIGIGRKHICHGQVSGTHNFHQQVNHGIIIDIIIIAIILITIMSILLLAIMSSYPEEMMMTTLEKNAIFDKCLLFDVNVSDPKF
jgi:hypothetical protein